MMRRVDGWRRIALSVVLLAALSLAACGGDDDDDDGASGEGQTETPTEDVGPAPIGGGGGEGDIDVTSTAFKDGAEIPEQYTCSGEDIAPPVSWTGVPQEAKSLALVMDDPDAEGFVHWLVYDIPVKVTGFEATPDQAELPSGAKQGKNSFGDVGYGGPCPPAGEEHTYRFRVLALEAELGLDPEATSQDVSAAVDEAGLAGQGTLTGTFAR
jgi:Raf kinase inhibitor-like YbhB/YbcL family protein